MQNTFTRIFALNCVKTTSSIGPSERTTSRCFGIITIPFSLEGYKQMFKIRETLQKTIYENCYLFSIYLAFESSYKLTETMYVLGAIPLQNFPLISVLTDCGSPVNLLVIKIVATKFFSSSTSNEPHMSTLKHLASININTIFCRLYFSVYLKSFSR